MGFLSFLRLEERKIFFLVDLVLGALLLQCRLILELLVDFRRVGGLLAQEVLGRKMCHGRHEFGSYQQTAANLYSQDSYQQLRHLNYQALPEPSEVLENYSHCHHRFATFLQIPLS